MKPATEARADRLGERLLALDPAAGTFRDAHVRDLPAYLRAGDLLVVNDAAALPASLRGTVADGGARVELRLAGAPADADGDMFPAVLFGAGDWRARTEDRPAPPALAPGAEIDLGDGLRAAVVSVSPRTPRLVHVRLSPGGDPLWPALYGRGRPVQYAYLRRPLELFDVQTGYASRPWAAEMPSAGRPLAWSLLLDLLRRGVRIAALTHAASLSSIGDSTLDALLPLPERYEIPEATVRAIASAGRVVAVGTTVVRALEGSVARNGRLVSGRGETDLVVAGGFRPAVVDGLLTGMHEPGTSHWKLMEAFAPRGLLQDSWAHAERAGYLAHELGDSCLVLAP